jgi:hypothetical protein
MKARGLATADDVLGEAAVVRVTVGAGVAFVGYNIVGDTARVVFGVPGLKTMLMTLLVDRSRSPGWEHVCVNAALGADSRGTRRYKHQNGQKDFDSCQISSTNRHDVGDSMGTRLYHRFVVYIASTSPVIHIPTPSSTRRPLFLAAFEDEPECRNGSASWNPTQSIWTPPILDYDNILAPHTWRSEFLG